MVYHPHNEAKGGAKYFVNMLQKWLCAVNGNELPI